MKGWRHGRDVRREWKIRVGKMRTRLEHERGGNEKHLNGSKPRKNQQTHENNKPNPRKPPSRSSGVGTAYLILNKIKTIKKSRGGNKHILLSYIPTNTDSPTGSKSPMSLKWVIQVCV